MEDAGMGWIASIIIGGIAGWVAEKPTRSNMGLIINSAGNDRGRSGRMAVQPRRHPACGGMAGLSHRRDRGGVSAHLRHAIARA